MIDKTIQENERVHDRVAKNYNSRHIEIYNPIEQNRIDLVITSILERFRKERSSIKVLDYGAGTGNLTKFFLQNNCDVTSLDISQESLELLQRIYSDYENLQIKKFDGYDIPYEDETFDLVATYSVLHHIPHYFKALDDMMRVITPGGMLYIDHEHNHHHWNPSQELLAYINNYNSLINKIKSIVSSGEIFEWEFWKGLYIRKFINPRHVNEGDIHVWKDDHIEWDKIIAYLRKNGFEILEDVDYLGYYPNVSIEEYTIVQEKITNMKYILARKSN